MASLNNKDPDKDQGTVNKSKNQRKRYMPKILKRLEESMKVEDEQQQNLIFNG